VSTKPVILIDGSSYLYRAFHALPPLTNSQGEPTGAVYGVINMIRKLLNEYHPDHIAVIFDPKGKTHRDSIYPYYKANRPPMPDELQAQILPVHEIIKAMGLPLIMIEGEEADDVIGTLAKNASANGQQVIISTGDKDMAQLVDDQVTLVNTMSDTVLNKITVKEKFGVPPDRIIDYLTLMGDSVDNIPGVPKVGPKTAVKWLEQYGSLAEVINHAKDIPGKVGENLRETIPKLALSKELVTIRHDLTLPVHLHDLTRKEADQEKLAEWFKRLEFRSWLNEVLETTVKTKSDKYDYKTILTESEFEKLLQQLHEAKIFAFDTETTSLSPLQAELVGASFAIKPEHAFYIPVGHDYTDAPQQLSKDFVIKKLRDLFSNSHLTVVGQNLKYDMSVLDKYNIKFATKIFDTMLESYILNSTSNRHDMDSLALKYLARLTTKFEDIAGKASKQKAFNQITLEEAVPYACQDADVTLQLHHFFWPKIENDSKLKRVLTEIEFPLVLVLAKMERIGVLIDEKKLHKLSTEFGKRCDELEKEAHYLAKKEFNLSSPKQLQEILYQDLKIPVQEKTPTGQPSTSESVLEALSMDYPLPKVILEYRSLSKLKSTYADGLAEQVDKKTGRVHTSYNQAVTATGRLSSTDPNLQNIPARREEGRRIRQAFIAPKGHKIISADYSQVELRIMAHLSRDKGLQKAFQGGLDIHAATAAEVFDVPLKEITPEFRRRAKAINFGLIYGMSAFGLAQQLGEEREAAQRYINLYFQRYPGVKDYMDTIRATAHNQGYVETLFGRRLYLPEINASNMQRRRAAERAAINAPMQGTAADIIKLAMLHIDQWISKSNLDIKMIMQVHDELVFEVAERDVKEASEHIREYMSNVVELVVPIVVDVGVGDNWDEAH
jgi:DNA polymerase-1